MKFSRRRTIAAAVVRAAAARYYDGPVSDHFDGTRFFDRDGVPPRSPLDLLRWRMAKGGVPWPDWAPSPYSDRPPAREPSASTNACPG